MTQTLVLAVVLGPLGTAMGVAAADALAPREKAAMTGWVSDVRFAWHDTGTGHPERPERLQAIVAAVEEAGLDRRLLLIEPILAELSHLELAHTPDYIHAVRTGCESGAAYVHSRDTPVSALSFETARLAAGGVLRAIDAVMEGRVRNAFCAVRPPGHHALRDRAMGFCLFNNVAIGARYLQTRYGLTRILIVDWDVHHGNGTQAEFEEDPGVLFFSVHQHPFYPGSGRGEERGVGAGEGLTVNVPLLAGSGDDAVIRSFREHLLPAVSAFRPQFVLISAGFDAHRDDPLGGMEMTPEGFTALTRMVRTLAETHADGRLVSVLEGGYDLEGLAQSVTAHLRELMVAPPRTIRVQDPGAEHGVIE